MAIHELAGKRAPQSTLTNIADLVTRYFVHSPDPAAPTQRISFGTSGHRGSSVTNSFNEAHITAICAALVEHRRDAGITGPLFIGRDTHALSEAAYATAIEVLAAHDIHVVVDSGSRYTPTPVISHAILKHNRSGDGGRAGRATAARPADLADGIVITPSHNPPADGGFKYNPPTGGPADTGITTAIERRANALLEAGLDKVPRVSLKQALSAGTTAHVDIGEAYIRDLADVLDMEAIASAGVRIGVDPMGGAAVDYWERIANAYGLDITVVNPVVDASFSFMPLDWDGRIRMDCSSPYAMAGLIAMKDQYDIAFGNDPDGDRHGIVAPSAGLLNPNHFLAVAIWYLFQNRDGWSTDAAIGKTLVSSSIIDRVANSLGRRVIEVPVGFKWFVDGLISGEIAFAGEESAGASFTRRDGSVWTTDKDGIILALLAAEITARTDRDPGEIYHDIERRFGAPVYQRIDAPASAEQKAALLALSPDDVKTDLLAGEKIIARLTRAPGNDAAIGGLKVVTENGWFAARPSGTEDVYKIYAESFLGGDHLRQIQEEARAIVG
ncbi:MAG: phosphoglucomutase (alpha-D-glucose-1,6-bisphosphate-dependent) [Gemmatimonadetes bacterium]|nr:phosphoglucomutase (alpha-D-glucose-1,6-bisphosphate-dependent) [Gemmatimonadota bacterium]